MGGPQHAAPAINAVIDDEEVVISWKLVFVYTVHTTFGRSAAQTLTGRD
jgi:hypothetical protein